MHAGARSAMRCAGRAVAGFVIFAGLSVGVGRGAAQAVRASTPSQLLAHALADAAAQGSMHQTTRELAGSRHATFSDDVATHSGRQEITITGGIVARVEVVGASAYFVGNRQALTIYFGIPRDVARAVGSRWVEVPSSSHAYGPVAAAATLPSALSELTPTGHLTETPPTTMAGAAVIGIRGGAATTLKQPGTETLYISRTGNPLPVYASFHLRRTQAAPATTIATTLTSWDEHLHVTAPVHAIPIDRLTPSTVLEATRR